LSKNATITAAQKLLVTVRIATIAVWNVRSQCVTIPVTIPPKTKDATNASRAGGKGVEFSGLLLL
jgi:hypothetical protein